MMNILILEDDPERIDKFSYSLVKPGVNVYIVRTAHMAISYLHTYHFDMVFLDHDLGLSPHPNPGSGSDVARWIVRMRIYNRRFRRTKFYIHSMNDEKARDMYSMLRGAGLNVKDTPLIWEQMAQIAAAS